MSKKIKVLLVEDDPNLGLLLSEYINAKGYECTLRVNGQEGYDTFVKGDFDFLIFDVMMPVKDGFTLAKEIRGIDKDTPILFLTAKSLKEDTLKGFNVGADDYMTKPFNIEELILRVQNLLKRSSDESSSEMNKYEFGDNYVNFVTYEAKGAQGEFRLTKKEVLLLKMLIERKNEVVSRKEILQNVWGYDVYPSTRTIDNFILSFRKYFEVDPKNPEYFYSVRGVGYKFVD